jgi:hypothetical protein
MGRFAGGGLSQAQVQALVDAGVFEAASYTDTVASGIYQNDIAAIPFRSGVLQLIHSHAGMTTQVMANRTSYWHPFKPAKAVTLSKVAVEQTVAGEAGSIIRLAIAEDSDGFPSDILWQSSAIPGDGSNGEKSEDPNLAIVPSKLYYAGVMLQAAPTTRPTLRAFQNFGTTGARTHTSAIAATGRCGFGYTVANDNAIPDPLVAGSVTVGGAPHVGFWLQAD